MADSTDVHAFRHPSRKDTVVLIENFIPLQQPNGGPTFYEFGDDVLYEIKVSHTNRCEADISYQFRFHTRVRNPRSFLYNTGPITSLRSSAWNRPQTYSVTPVKGGRRRVLAERVPCPPVNVGVRSTPDCASLAAAAVTDLGGRRKVLAGQRADAFFVDLGSILGLPGNGYSAVPGTTQP